MSADLVAESQELLSVLEQLPEGVVLLGEEAIIVFANKPALRLLKLKPKTALGSPFLFPLEDGPMRDLDVEMLVKPVTWAGRAAHLVHLKSLKGAGGAFHLEWKLEAALEKARAAEQQLEQWKQESASQGPSPEEQAEREAARLREQELSARVAELEGSLRERQQEFEERQSELESLLEMAESRADELQSQAHREDHQAATELQTALAAAREAEEQVRELGHELEQARDRIKVAEEQAEVAEERAYTLETELERLTAELEHRPEASAWEELQDELMRLRSEQQRGEAELQALSEQQKAAWQAELAKLEQQLATREEELTLLTERAEARDEELARGRELLAQAEERIQAAEQAHRRAEEHCQQAQAAWQEQASQLADLEQRTSSLLEEKGQALERGAEQEAQLVSLQQQLQGLQEQFAAAQEELRLRREESDELAEQLRAETEQSEEAAELLREEAERTLEALRQAQESLQEAQASSELYEQECRELQSRLQENEERWLQQREVLEERARLEKEVQKLTLQLEEVRELAERGEKADKLERKLEGALRRAEEAEERLEEERRLLQELRQTSERRIAELESRSSASEGSLEVDSETERLAFQDPLTGLPNRNILQKYLGFMLQQSARYERYTAMLRLDLDRFKAISDTFGPDVGDRLIRLVGERLSSVVRASDVLGRLGEDEFVMLLSDLPDQKEASVITASVIKRVYHAFKKPFLVEEQNISVGASIGVSLYPLDAANGEQMFQHASVALKRAKETGRGHAQYFTAEVQSSHEARMMVDQELKSGLERGEFGLLYQPIFDLSNGQMVGVEALIRWNHPRLGSIGPDEFLRVAEESGLIVLIGNWALRSALQKAAQWQAAGLGLFVSLNLSRRQLLQADLVPTIHATLAEFRCPPERILFEISEELTGPELPRLRDTLGQLQQLGVRLAVDNFGTSASSLMELRRGPFQVLKIDRRFVRGVPSQEENAGIVLSALTLGHHLGRITVAVGVETEAEKTWLAKTGCRFAQGNLLSHPLPPEHIQEIVGRR